MKISEISQRYGLTPDTLRYYEKIGLIAPVPRNASGIRNYSEDEIKRIEFIKCMRRAGIPLQTLIEYIELAKKGDDTISLRREILLQQREQLVVKMRDLQETLNFLEYKIKIYDKAVLNAKKDLRSENA
jgi:DNA-binding transcriptional MerR regulator